MSKYYVACGPIQSIVLADSPEQAARTGFPHGFQGRRVVGDQAPRVEIRMHTQPHVIVGQDQLS